MRRVRRAWSFESEPARAHRVGHRFAAEPHTVEGVDVGPDRDVDVEAGVDVAHRRALRVDNDPVAAVVIGEADVQHGAPVGQLRGVDTPVHPPHKQLGIELERLWVAEDVLRRPLAESEHDRTQGVTRSGEVVLAVEAVDEPGVLQPAQTFREQTARQARQAACEIVEPRRPEEEVAHDEHGPSLAEEIDGPRDRAVLAVTGALHGRGRASPSPHGREHRLS